MAGLTSLRGLWGKTFVGPLLTPLVLYVLFVPCHLQVHAKSRSATTPAGFPPRKFSLAEVVNHSDVTQLVLWSYWSRWRPKTTIALLAFAVWSSTSVISLYLNDECHVLAGKCKIDRNILQGTFKVVSQQSQLQFSLNDLHKQKRPSARRLAISIYN